MNSGITRCLAWGLCLLAHVAAARAQAAWPERLFNPQSKPDDVVLPMPCGGAMAFRRVAVPSTGLLDDRRVQLGGSDARYAYLENSRSDYVAGGFSDPKVKSSRYYLLGKYEVTRGQYDAIVSGTCAAPSSEGRLPKASLTWTESVVFASRYSAWMVGNALDKLPTEGGVPGFVRLPTEAEWEFAARGGIAVDNPTFEQPSFPMPDGAPRYIWYGGSDSSNNAVRAVGLLQPNPLGLHDMLGNVAEFVLDPFRMNKHSRSHGQAGGYTIKGGDFRTPLEDIRTAARDEYTPTDRNGEHRSDSTGFRVALIAPALPNRQIIDQVRAAWKSAAQSGPVAGASPAAAPGPVNADPVQEVETLARAITDPALKQRLGTIGSVLRANIQARNEQRDRSAKAQLQVGAYLGRIIARDIRVTNALQDPKVVAQYQPIIDDNMRYITDVVRQLGLDFPSASMEQQGEVLKREYEARGRGEYVPLVDLVVDYARRARNGQLIQQKALYGDLKKLVLK